MGTQGMKVFLNTVNSEISLFESPIVECTLAPLCHITKTFPWSDDQEPVTKEEISDALLRPEHLIAPGEFVDSLPNDEQRDNFLATRTEHIRRIAWFVLNWDGEQEFIAIGGMMLGEPVLNLSDGHHRLLAAWFREEISIRIKLEYGSKSEMESMKGFIRWVHPPASARLFGCDYIAVGDDVCELRFDGYNKYWINDGATGGCVSTLKIGMLLQMYGLNSQFSGRASGEEANLDNMLTYMLQEYPSFKVFREQITREVERLSYYEK